MADPLDDASTLLTGRAKTSVLAELRAQLDVAHSEHPQRAMLATIALDNVELGLAELAKLGHSFILVAKDQASPDEFPKMLYRQQSGRLQTMTVESPEQAAALGSGWAEHPRDVVGGGPEPAAPVDGANPELSGKDKDQHGGPEAGAPPPDSPFQDSPLSSPQI